MTSATGELSFEWQRNSTLFLEYFSKYSISILDKVSKYYVSLYSSIFSNSISEKICLSIYILHAIFVNETETNIQKF